MRVFRFGFKSRPKAEDGGLAQGSRARRRYNRTRAIEDPGITCIPVTPLAGAVVFGACIRGTDKWVILVCEWLKISRRGQGSAERYTLNREGQLIKVRAIPDPGATSETCSKRVSHSTRPY